MSSESAKEVEHWMSKFAPMSDAEIRATMAGWKTHAPGWIAGDLVLQQRARERDSTKPLLTSLNEQVTGIAGRMAVVEDEAKKPEYKKWGFWFAVFAVIVAVISLLRDFWDIKGTP